MSAIIEKICVVCGKDVSAAKRTKDPKGKYYCQPCYDALAARHPAPAAAAVSPHAPISPLGMPAAADNPYAVLDFPAEPVSPPQAVAPRLAPGTRVCPCCGQTLAPKAKVCIPCGIKVPSGRPLITALGRDENQLYGNAESIIRVVAWLIPLSLYPIASEAYASRKPIVIWVVAALCTIASIAFAVAIRSDPSNPALVNLMLWPNDASSNDDSPQAALTFYQQHHDDHLGEMMRSVVEEQTGKPFDAKNPDQQELGKIYHMILRLRTRGEFHWYQLLTNTFLHDYSTIWGFIMHLGGNMLFLLIFGTRVNALVGNLKMLGLYPLLAVLASIGHLMTAQGVFPVPALGASGAIMGLAGMYLIFFPVHRVYMAFWIKPFLWRAAWIKIWPVRGFWVLLFYISFDIVATFLRSHDHVAHGAHLGGFISGMIIAVVLLTARWESARNADLLSVLLGKYAWPLVGRPNGLRNPRSAPAKTWQQAFALRR